MVHRREHGNDNVAVREGEDGNFGARQELLDEDAAAARAEDVIDHHVLDGGFRLSKVLRNDDAFPERQPVCLNDGGIGRVLQICDGCLGLGERFALCRGDAVFFHEFLGKDLAAFDDGGVFGGAEAGDARRFQRIDAAQNERIVGRDDGEVHIPLTGEADNAFDVRRLDGEAFRVLRDAPVAGQGVNFARAPALIERFDDGVLSAAASYD